MELGANKKSVATLAGLLAVLAFLVYYQFFRETGVTGPQRRPVAPTEAAIAGASSAPAPPLASRAGRRGGRFQPRLGRPQPGDRPDPMTADATLRTGLLERVRGIEAPMVERDIFNFGRPKKPPVAPPTQEEVNRAQARLEATMATRRPAVPGPAPRASAPRAKPPNWKYYGLANDPDSKVQRAFLLDGEDILVAAEGSVFQGRYRIERIGWDAVVLQDLQADQEFSIRLEAPR